MSTSYQVLNPYHETLDVLVEGSSSASQLILFVHGFGTDKHEHGLFDDLSQTLQPNFLIVRFDFSGYGLSQGKQNDVNYRKQVQDLKTIIDWADANNPALTLNILAMSMGCYVAAMLQPQNIKRTILLSIPHQNTSQLKSDIQKRILDKGGSINSNGTSLYPRSHGETQQLGPSFWEEMAKLDPLTTVTQYTQLTNLLIIHPLQDEIVATKYVQKYKLIKSAHYLELPGNHSWSIPQDRQHLLTVITRFFS